MNYIYFKFLLSIFKLRRFFTELYNLLIVNDYNYVSIKKCFDENYLICLKNFSWLDEVAILIKGNDTSNPFVNFRRFNIDKIRFNNIVEIPLPDNLNNYSIVVQYSLKPYGLFKKNYKPKERIVTETIGDKRNKLLTYKIVEKF